MKKPLALTDVTGLLPQTLGSLKPGDLEAVLDFLSRVYCDRSNSLAEITSKLTSKDLE